MKTALTIAGSDSSGGAGIQADLKTFAAHHVFGMSTITAVTSQNTMGVSGVFDLPGEVVASQLDAVFTDIFPDGVKIGMVSNGEIIRVICEKLRQYQPRYIVGDPVMVSTSGHRLMREDAIDILTAELLPLCSLITPNIPEAEILWGRKIVSEADMIKGAEYISSHYTKNVLIKGGHLDCSSNDLLFDGEHAHWYRCEKLSNENIHGTGCTLSSAICANLAIGNSMPEAVGAAKEYITGAIRAGLNLGKGKGPLDHGWRLDTGIETR